MSACVTWGVTKRSNRRHVFQSNIKISVFLLTNFAGPAGRSPAPIALIDTSLDAEQQDMPADKVSRCSDSYPQCKAPDRVSWAVHRMSRFHSLKPIVSACIVITDLSNLYSREISEGTPLWAEQSQSVAVQKHSGIALRPQRGQGHQQTTASHVERHVASTL